MQRETQYGDHKHGTSADESNDNVECKLLTSSLTYVLPLHPTKPCQERRRNPPSKTRPAHTDLAECDLAVMSAPFLGQVVDREVMCQQRVTSSNSKLPVTARERELPSVYLSSFYSVSPPLFAVICTWLCQTYTLPFVGNLADGRLCTVYKLERYPHRHCHSDSLHSFLSLLIQVSVSTNRINSDET